MDGNQDIRSGNLTVDEYLEQEDQLIASCRTELTTQGYLSKQNFDRFVVNGIDICSSGLSHPRNDAQGKS